MPTVATSLRMIVLETSTIPEMVSPLARFHDLPIRDLARSVYYVGNLVFHRMVVPPDRRPGSIKKCSQFLWRHDGALLHVSSFTDLPAFIRRSFYIHPSWLFDIYSMSFYYLPSSLDLW
jgi:hypothetical protein